MNRRSLTFISVALLVTVLIVGLYLFLPDDSDQELRISYPLDGTLFPPDFAAPTLSWVDDDTAAAAWEVTVTFEDGALPVKERVSVSSWTPARETWEAIKKGTLEHPARLGVSRAGHGFGRAGDTVAFAVSADSVGAPIFFRDVPLPFRYAVEHMDSIRWRLGDVSSYEPPKVVLDNMMMCGNCHSFTADGSALAMDIDYANDKGSYIITPIEPEIALTKDKIITWSDYRREDGDLTFGLLSQISPDGRFVASMVKDRSVFVPVDELMYSQLFFPLKGILAYYDIAGKTFHAIPGASDPYYVQSNPRWSPDGRWLVFARNVADSLRNVGSKVVLDPADCEEYLTGGKKFRFDLFRIPFNDGAGGEPEPIPGAADPSVSEYFATYSPDGRWIVFCRGDSFMLLQPDSALYIIPAEGGVPRRMTCNTDSMNSWHSWSPNGKWLVFSSKARGPYTQLYLTHIDENGNDSPPVVLERFIGSNRAANIPEFVNIHPDAMNRMHEQFIDFYSYTRKAGELVNFGELEQAEQLFRKAIQLNPGDAAAYRGLGSLLTRIDRVEDARTQWEQAVKLDPKDPATHLGLGIIHLNSGDYDNAKREFTTAIRLDETCAAAHEGLGVIYYVHDEYDAAREQFETAIRHDNRLPDAHFRLGTIHMMNGDLDAAKTCFDHVVRLKYDAEAYLLLGRIHAQQGDMPDAVKAFDIVRQNDPKDPRPPFLLGRLYAVDDTTVPQAIDLLQTAVELDPKNTEAWIELGNARLKTSDKAGALSAFRRALELEPNAPGLREYIEKLGG